MSVKLIVFDFDGTIADTYDTFIAIVDRLSGQFGYPSVNREAISQMRHLSSREIVQQSEIPLWKIPFLLRKATSELGKEIAYIKPVRGIPETLRILKDRGYQLGILTSNSQKNVRVFLKKNSLIELFDFLDTGTGIFGKDKAIKTVMRRHRIGRNNLIYVGDETRDIEAAKKSNVKVIAVGWGFNSPEVLIANKPSFYANDPQDLVEVIINE
ncbi:MAG: HAD-IA family hydrolase [Cyanobacteriota bacterium]|nr:HAD-IA family hydrolase [Cyanobacteriota bacterium]